MESLSSYHHNIHFNDYTKKGHIPSKEHVNSGLFDQHFFNINPTNELITKLVEARVFYSEFLNPTNNQNEKYLMVGVTGREDGKNRREKTDIVIVIDRSGSMGMGLSETQSFDTPNFDDDEYLQFLQYQKSKMSLTIEATKEIYQLLDEDEYIGILAFDNDLEIVEFLKSKGTIDSNRLFQHLDSIQDRGGTNMELGLSKAIEMLLQSPNSTRNKRIIFITDDCPNIGQDEFGLRSMAENAFIKSNGTIGVTYVGVGLNFNV
jgi:hypothetical protein